MNFYRRSAPRKSSTIHTYISNALESEIPIRRAKSPIEHLRIRPIYVPFATFGAMLRCVGVDIRTARLHDFLPADLVVFSIESLGQWSTAPTTQVGIRGSPSASEWSTAICPAGQSHTSPSLSILIRPDGELRNPRQPSLSFPNVCDVMLHCSID